MTLKNRKGRFFFADCSSPCKGYSCQEYAACVDVSTDSVRSSGSHFNTICIFRGKKRFFDQFFRGKFQFFPACFRGKIFLKFSQDFFCNQYIVDVAVAVGLSVFSKKKKIFLFSKCTRLHTCSVYFFPITQDWANWLDMLKFLGYIFSWYKLCSNFDKKWVGQHLGNSVINSSGHSVCN
jgi:hypothetical protein